MTKPITGMAAMMLIDEGKLGLDQPLAEILPKVRADAGAEGLRRADHADNLEPAVRPITIRQLVTHTSGSATASSSRARSPRASVSAAWSRASSPGCRRCPVFRGTAVHGLDVFADRLAEFPLVYQPGTRWSYSMGLDLMGPGDRGRLGPAVRPLPAGPLLRSAGMHDTHFQVPRADAGRMTTSYYLANGTLLPIDLGADSIFFDDPAAAVRRLGPRQHAARLRPVPAHARGDGTFEGKRVMSEAAVRMGTSNLLPDTVQQDRPNGWLGLDLSRYGFGAGGRVGKGLLAGTYGWAGAAGTVAFVDTRTGLRGGLFTQYMPSTAYPLTRGVSRGGAQGRARRQARGMTIAFAGQPLDRADHVRADPRGWPSWPMREPAAAARWADPAAWRRRSACSGAGRRRRR
jgi:CubicO group peptidase (beta-lactamase class C family)